MIIIIIAFINLAFISKFLVGTWQSPVLPALGSGKKCSSCWIVFRRPAITGSAKRDNARCLLPQAASFWAPKQGRIGMAGKGPSFCSRPSPPHLPIPRSGKPLLALSTRLALLPCGGGREQQPEPRGPGTAGGRFPFV